jgi:hypothetical protein
MLNDILNIKIMNNEDVLSEVNNTNLEVILWELRN